MTHLLVREEARFLLPRLLSPSFYWTTGTRFQRVINFSFWEASISLLPETASTAQPGKPWRALNRKTKLIGRPLWSLANLGSLRFKSRKVNQPRPPLWQINRRPLNAPNVHRKK